MKLVPVQTPGVGKQGRRRDIRTRTHMKRLLEIFEKPPPDYDGSNAKLAEYLGLSTRQVIRVLNELKRDNVIKVENSVCRRPGGGVWTNRTIYLVKEH